MVSCIVEGLFFILIGLMPPELVLDYYLHPVLGIFVGAPCHLKGLACAAHRPLLPPPQT